MLQSWADRLIRIGAGLAVLVLPAAQAKVCPWLIPPPAETGEAAGALAIPEPTAPDAAQQPAQPHPGSPEPQKPGRPPLTITALVPDAVPVRTHVPTPAALRDGAGWRAGVVACGPRGAGLSASSSAAILADGWFWRALRDASPATAVQPVPQCRTAGNPALFSAILTTGPPRA